MRKPLHKTILVVDDNGVNRIVARAMIISIMTNFFDPPIQPVIMQAEDGQQALDIMNFAQVDLVLMDLMMPVMDGAKAIRELRAYGHKTPVIVASSMDRENIRLLPLQSIQAILPKPLDMETLGNALAESLGIGTRIKHRNSISCRSPQVIPSLSTDVTILPNDSVRPHPVGTTPGS
jgi:CheY-like chemotaxis protein